MKKLDKLRSELEKVTQEIEQLQKFRPTKQTRQLLRHLFAESSFVKDKIKKLQLSATEKIQEKQQRRQKANLNRSGKMRRAWIYFKAIQQTWFPDKSVKEIRSDFTKFKRGLESDINEIIWRNPSP